MDGRCFTRNERNGRKIFIRVEGKVPMDEVDLVDRSDVEPKYMASIWKQKLYYDYTSDGMIYGLFFLGGRAFSKNGLELEVVVEEFEEINSLPVSLELSPDLNFERDFDYAGGRALTVNGSMGLGSRLRF
jgi:hypothetical protein